MPGGNDRTGGKRYGTDDNKPIFKQKGTKALIGGNILFLSDSLYEEIINEKKV